MVKRFAILIFVVTIVSASCSDSSDGDDTTTSVTEATEDTGTPPPSTDEGLPTLFVATPAAYQFGSQGNYDPFNSPTVSPQTELASGNFSFPGEDSDSESNIEWPASLGNGFIQLQASAGSHGCFISTQYIFVKRSEIGSNGDIMGTSVGAYDSAFDGDVYPSADVAHVEVEPGVDTMALVVELLVAGIPAAPEYAISTAPRWRYGPGTPPIVPGPNIPGTERTTDVYGSVNVIDSFGDNSNKAAAFHGDFISGILRRLGVETGASQVGFPNSNFAAELVVASSVTEGMNNISMGGYECGVQEGTTFLGSDGKTIEIPDDLNENGISGEGLPLPPIAIPAVLYGDPENSVLGISAVIVASAGNDGTANGCHPETFPARYASYTDDIVDTLPAAVRDYYEGINTKVVSVGALSGEDGSYARASFSNCGVNTVWAPGVAIVSDYGDKTAVWAGTSFAAPVVAAALERGEFQYP